MAHLDKTKMHGLFHIELIDATTGELVQEIDVENHLTTFPREQYLKLLAGKTSGLAIDDLCIRYFAIGDGGSPASTKQTKLDNERYRQQVTARALKADRLLTTVSIQPDVQKANFHIKEIGVFCGAKASLAKNSGTMLARVQVDIEKNSNLLINIQRQDIVELN